MEAGESEHREEDSPSLLALKTKAAKTGDEKNMAFLPSHGFSPFHISDLKKPDTFVLF